MFETFRNRNRACTRARDKALRTGYYYSVILKVNVHTHDYEFQVVPHIWPDEAAYIYSPNGTLCERQPNGWPKCGDC